MKVLVTGSSGHLGEALVRTLRALAHEVVGLDILDGPFTTGVGSISDRSSVRRAMAGVRTVFHTATLHKPHIVTHTRRNFVDTNIIGTLNLLEEAVAQGVGSFIYTSTTSVFGDALITPRGCSGRVGHRADPPHSQEHLRRHQGGCGRPLPVVQQEPGAGLHHYVSGCWA